ncbi:MAG: hypothetical protein HY000_12340 [Planctomycetes bacterium]|nr:hypothetical protein [Planctomycetota bacterium]
MPNVLLAASEGLLTRVGSISAGLDRFMSWRVTGILPVADQGQELVEHYIRAGRTGIDQRFFGISP